MEKMTVNVSREAAESQIKLFEAQGWRLVGKDPTPDGYSLRLERDTNHGRTQLNG